MSNPSSIKNSLDSPKKENLTNNSSEEKENLGQNRSIPSNNCQNGQIIAHQTNNCSGHMNGHMSLGVTTNQNQQPNQQNGQLQNLNGTLERQICQTSSSPNQTANQNQNQMQNVTQNQLSPRSMSCITKDQMLEYLKPKNASKFSRYNTNMVITLRHAKVVQKSYGTEKRFFCPPPIVKISGQGWKNRNEKKESLHDLMVFIYIGAPSGIAGQSDQLGLIASDGVSGQGQSNGQNNQNGNRALTNGHNNSNAMNNTNQNNQLQNTYPNQSTAFAPNSEYAMHAASQGLNPHFPPGPPGPNGFPPDAFGHPNPFAPMNTMNLHPGFMPPHHMTGAPPHHMSNTSSMNTTTAAYEPQQLNFNGCDYCTAKQLFINDTDKRKHFELHVKCLFNGGTDLGTFSSKRIKVISKPSKKKQTLKNNELSIQSGSKIALYNRLRSQTVSTRYLNVENEEFKASSTEWGAFTIYLLENPEQSDDDEDGFDAKIGGDYIKYGDTVKLVHTETQIALPKMILRRVDKIDTKKNCNDPISQMHKCAFEFRYPEKSDYAQYGSFYMALAQDNITQLAGSKKTEDTDTITEAAAWTIVSIESIKYSFNDCFATQKLAINPVPIVYNIKKSGTLSQNTAMIEVEGENFSNTLQVWFDHVPAETIYRCSEILLCKVPQVGNFKEKLRQRNQSASNDNPTGSDQNTKSNILRGFSVNLTIVRSDGILFPTYHKYIYDALGLKRLSLNGNNLLGQNNSVRHSSGNSSSSNWNGNHSNGNTINNESENKRPRFGP